MALNVDRKSEFFQVLEKDKSHFIGPVAEHKNIMLKFYQLI